jgi:hypothetical protein
MMTIVSKRPSFLINTDAFEQEEYEHQWGEILTGISDFFKNLVSTFKQAKLTQLVLSIDTVQKLCTLILSNDFKKKSTQKNVRAIFT